MIQVQLKIDLSALKAFAKDLKASKGHIERMWLDVAAAYRSAVLRRFRTFSRGGGNWKPLGPVTIAAKGSSAILIDTGRLVSTLNPAFIQGDPVKLLSQRSGVIVSFANVAHQKAKMTVADLAAIHHLGLNVPKREILIQPDDKIIKTLLNVIKTHIRKHYGDQSV